VGDALGAGQYAYDETGHLVAIRRRNQVTNRAVLITWEGDRLVDLASDSNDDGKPDELYRYAYEKDTIRWEEVHSDGFVELEGFYVVADGRFVARRKPDTEWKYTMPSGQLFVQKKPANRIEYVWQGNRLIEARGFPAKGKKPHEVGRYRYDCAP
jgi:hypothetical protein